MREAVAADMRDILAAIADRGQQEADHQFAHDRHMIPQIGPIICRWMVPAMDDRVACLDRLGDLRVAYPVERHVPPRCQQIKFAPQRPPVEIEQLLAQLLTRGLCAVGRPSLKAGPDHLAQDLSRLVEFPLGLDHGFLLGEVGIDEILERRHRIDQPYLIIGRCHREPLDRKEQVLRFDRRIEETDDRSVEHGLQIELVEHAHQRGVLAGLRKHFDLVAVVGSELEDRRLQHG